MSKTAKKSKSVVSRSRINPSIAFDSNSFILGNKIILTGYLAQDSRNEIIRLYKNKVLNNQLYKPIIERDKCQKYVLTQIEAQQLIRSYQLKSKQKPKIASIDEQLQRYSICSQRLDQFLSNYHSQRQANESIQDLGAFSMSLKHQFYHLKNQLYTKLSNHQHQSNYQNNNQTYHNFNNRVSSKQLHQQKLRIILAKQCLQIEKQLFISTIVMIIQHNNSSAPSQQKHQHQLQAQIFPQQQINSKHTQTNELVLLIFQQSYLPQQISKSKIIQLIGQQVYQNKVLVGIKIYQYSKNHKNKLNNPTFITCHHCMKIIQNINFPQDRLKCLKAVSSQQNLNVQSKFAFTPQKYLKNILEKKYFDTSHQDQSQFTHPYIQYQCIVKDNVKQLIGCNRHWCGQCYVRNKSSIDFDKCPYCCRICQCHRCKLFQQLIQHQALYLQNSGKLQYFDEKFIFNQIFLVLKNNDKSWPNGTYNYYMNDKSLQNIGKAYKEQLKSQSEYYKSNNILSNIYQLQNVSQILTTFPTNTLQHNDKFKRTQNIQLSKYKQGQRNYKKQIKSQKAINIEAIIDSFNSQTRNKFKQLAKNQYIILKRRLEKSKILLDSDPLRNFRNIHKQKQILIIQQPITKKNQRSFKKIVEFKQQNLFKKDEKQRQYKKIKRLENQQYKSLQFIQIQSEQDKKINRTFDENEKQGLSQFQSFQSRLKRNQSKLEKDKDKQIVYSNQNTFGNSLWQ